MGPNWFRKAVATRARVGVVLVVCPTLMGISPGLRAQPDRSKSAVMAPAVGQPITLNFKDAEIDAVVAAFGHLLQRTFLIDPRVRGKVTLETPRPVTPAAAYELLQSTLRVQGFAIVETGTLSRVVPEADAKLQAGPVTSGRRPEASGDRIVTQIFRLSYESPTNLVPVLRPLIAPNNSIVAYPSNNSLVITDYASNVQRLARIVAALDAPATGEIDVVLMKHALASDVAAQASRLIDDTVRASNGTAGVVTDPGQRVTVLADPRLNAIVLRSASPARLSLARNLITSLDQPSSEPGNIRVVYLRNAEATRLVPVLRGVLGAEGGGASSAAPASGTNGAMATFGGLHQGSTSGSGVNAGASGTALSNGNAGALTITAGGAVIAADAATNSLIITAPEPVYRNLRTVIDKLDARRVQVYIESLIVEVSADRAMELGVQWQSLSQPSGGGNAVIGGTNLPARGSGGNLIDATTNVLGLGRGLNIGVVRSQALIGGARANGAAAVGAINLGFLARALETEAGANILATPNLVTLDNEEARIIIGQNVPFVTGSFTATGSAAGAVNPFQTIERRDVGTTLRVRPQVAEGGTVRMQIFQEVSSVQDASLAAGLITNKRAIESNVLVDDGQVVVLGGLIEERVEGGVSMVPGLGRIPVLGQLFRYDSRKRVKTNLLVFLRPVVLRNAEASYGVTADRYDYIRQLQGDARLPRNHLIPQGAFTPAVLPPMPTRPVAPAVSMPGEPAENREGSGATAMQAPSSNVSSAPGFLPLAPTTSVEGDPMRRARSFKVPDSRDSDAALGRRERVVIPPEVRSYAPTAVRVEPVTQPGVMPGSTQGGPERGFASLPTAHPVWPTRVPATPVRPDEATQPRPRSLERGSWRVEGQDVTQRTAGHGR